MTGKNSMSVGVRFCSNCEYNLRCEECAYKEKFKVLAAKHDCVIDKAERAEIEINNLKAELAEKTKVIKSLERENSLLFSR
jgi:hypothetical protein